MLIVKDLQTYDLAIEFITQNEILAYDTETTGLSVRTDKVIGFGASNAVDGIYCPIWQWDASKRELCRTSIDSELVLSLLRALAAKSLICWNTSFDAMVTKYSLGVDILQSVYCDAMLLKHTIDENFPFGLKEVAAMVFGHDVKKEKEEMLASIKNNGGSPTEYYKANMEILAKYCLQDCLLTYKLFMHYSKEMR